MTIFKFTEARIRELPLGSGIHRDTDVKGLLCICHKTTKTYCAQGDVRREKRLIRSVRAKIGRTDLVRLADARSFRRTIRFCGKFGSGGRDRTWAQLINSSAQSGN